VKLAVASNIGGKPMTPNERKRLAIHLYQKHGWTQAQIGDVLGVSQSAVRDYLANSVDVPINGAVLKPARVGQAVASG
jgi:predicted transcriptional regulator